MIIIDFLDYSIIDTLILVKTFKPEGVKILADREEYAGKRAQHLVNAIRDMSSNTKVDLVPIDTKDILSAIDAVNKFAGQADELYMNIDADHGISTAVGYGSERKSNIVPICVDLKHGIIRNLLTLDSMAEIRHISLTDYLNAIGAKQLEDSHQLPKPDEYEAICNVARVLFKSVYIWNNLCTYIGKHYSHDHSRVRIPADLDGEMSERNAETVREQLNAFCKNGFLRPVGSDDAESTRDMYEFTSERHKNYMVVFGVWLEMYIYIKLQPYFDDVHCGFVIDWDSFDDYDTKDNEIDVVAIKNSRPVMISCKMRMPTKEDIYEIGYISEMLGGSQAVPVIATTAIVDHKQSYKPGLYPRFKKMNVGLIETIRIASEPMDNIINALGI
ncbi:MAG: DUF1887 family protein [Clostridiales bacterium]|nr:DUF1887 family protein [Candidatus Crickella merdequi]